MKGLKGVLTFGFLALLTACVAPPKGLEKERFNLHRYQDISSEDIACQCKTVRLGGKIMNTTILANKTKIEVLSLPVASANGEPLVESQSNGRFIAYFDGFVDPENLKDRYITLGGKLIGQEKGQIEQAEYEYPVVAIQKYRIWTLTKSYYYEPDDWDDGWGWPRPWFMRPGFGYSEIRYYLN